MIGDHELIRSVSRTSI